MTISDNYLLSQNSSTIITAAAYLLLFIPVLVVVIIGFVSIHNNDIPTTDYESPFGPLYACNSDLKYVKSKTMNEKGKMVTEKIPICKTINQDILNISKDEQKQFYRWYGSYYQCETEKDQESKPCTNLSNLLNNKKEAATSSINANSSLSSSQKTNLLNIVDSTYNYLSSDWKNRKNAVKNGSIPSDSPLCTLGGDNYCIPQSNKDKNKVTLFKQVFGNTNPTWSSLYNPTTEAPTTQAPDNSNEQENQAEKEGEEADEQIANEMDQTS